MCLSNDTCSDVVFCGMNICVCARACVYVVVLCAQIPNLAVGFPTIKMQFKAAHFPYRRISRNRENIIPNSDIQKVGDTIF